MRTIDSPASLRVTVARPSGCPRLQQSVRLSSRMWSSSQHSSAADVSASRAPRNAALRQRPVRPEHLAAQLCSRGLCALSQGKPSWSSHCGVHALRRTAAHRTQLRALFAQHAARRLAHADSPLGHELRELGVRRAGKDLDAARERRHGRGGAELDTRVMRCSTRRRTGLSARSVER